MVTTYSTTTTWDQYLGWDSNVVKEKILEKYKGQINKVEIIPKYRWLHTPTDHQKDRILLFTDNKYNVMKIKRG